MLIAGGSSDGTANGALNNAEVFDPAGNAGGSLDGATWEAKGAFVYGAGADYAFTKHLSLRAEYRGYVYKAPDFNLATVDGKHYTLCSQRGPPVLLEFFAVRCPQAEHVLLDGYQRSATTNSRPCQSHLYSSMPRRSLHAASEMARARG